MKHFIIGIIALLMLSACVVVETEPAQQAEESIEIEQEQTTEKQEVKENTGLRKAPDFSATTITGEEVSLESFEGKPSLIYFTASWCPLCAKNWPELNIIYDEFKDEVNIVAIGIDPTDDAEVLTKLAQEKGLKFPLVPGNPQIMLDFGVTSQATSVGLDSSGNIMFVKNKQHLTADEYKELIATLK